MDIRVEGDNNFVVGGDYHCHLVLTPEAVLLLWQLLRMRWPG
ncbi:hypothetical protein [Marinobacterium litorale]|jgi:hypothetical protein|nr:hypothetical protein [Marinobacterium litorale]